MSQEVDLAALILAAGAGTRMKSSLPKVLFELCGRSMLEYVLDAAASLEPTRLVVVVGHKGQEVIDAVENRWSTAQHGLNLNFVWQKEQLGTAHAVMSAKPSLEGFQGDVVILYGDTPLLTGDVLREFYEVHKTLEADLTIMTAFLENPGYYGRIVRDCNQNVKKIVEARDLAPEEMNIKEINAGMYVVKSEILLDLLSRVGNNNAKKEYYLTDIVELAAQRDLKTATYMCQDTFVAEGVNDRYVLSEAESVLRIRILKDLMLSGVTIRDPEHTYVDFGVEVGLDTVIEPGSYLRGKTKIGPGCVVGPMSEIIDSSVGQGSRVWFSVVENSKIGSNVQVGPYSHLRSQTCLEDGVSVGNYAEIKNSTIGKGTKVHHHSYIGDSDVGCDVNIGAGTVTVNYDGARKYRTRIGDGSFIGCNSNLIAPITIGNRAYVAAGSTLTDDVPEDALAIARERQVLKEGWVVKKKQS
jgi:bifunctional UDP-N-acetylglucosamine pyrophosphorylase/glucosamine-1-phosphate N-acetyltransferase